MILYDQDFNFIGMSAENLTFLGYEDIDEFTSMHNDFADLFVKREGLIHKFENFSWIHFVLYSGTPNKKAYVRHKNGTEMPVDVTIKEVILTHAYDGLRKIYSVKLINEQLDQISKSDNHDNRSSQSKEFSLSKLTKDLDMPKSDFLLTENPSPAHAGTSDETSQEMPSAAPVSSAHTAEEFILDIPPLEEGPEEQPAINHIDFGSAATHNETAQKPEAPATVEPKAKNDLFDFNLLKTEPAPTEEPLSPATATEATAEPERQDFDLLKSTSVEAPTEETPMEEAVETESEAQPFSFDLFKKVVPSEEETVEEQSTPSTKNEALIDQIKLDIEEIDADLPTDPQTQKEAEEALHRIVNMQKESAQAQSEPVHAVSHLPQEPAEAPADRDTVNVTMPQTEETVQEEQDFEKTLQEIFKISNDTKSPEGGKKSNSLNIEAQTLQDKRSITKEPIKSQTDYTAEEKLTLPELGNLGLSHEEEFDFIEEFLEDTEATISLMESYLKLEDFDNIKYSLIKISSSAEILHFDQLLEEARSLTGYCETKDTDQVAKKLEDLKKLTSRYREHFSTIIA